MTDVPRHASSRDARRSLAMKTLPMKALSIALAAVASLAHAQAAHAVGRLLDLSVYDRTSERTLPVYVHQGRYYVAGEPGHRYRIALRNRGGQDLLAVLSVDGINAVSGQTAAWRQTGYVLDAYAATDVPGWRKSLTHVADFVFADLGDSYAARTGRPGNVGVIGVALFRRRPDIQYAPNAAIAQEAAAPAARAADLQRQAKAGAPLGTGHGEREYSAVSEVAFERASDAPDEVVTLYYDTRENLVAQGILPAERPRPRRPDPFPGGFVPDP
jgi:hypothetical protein